MPVDVELRPVLRRIERPIGVAHAGDDRLFVIGQSGVIKVSHPAGDGWAEPTTFLNLRDEVECCGEQGLLGLAFHPDYARNGLFYITYSADRFTLALEERRVSTRSPDIADRRYRRTVLRLRKPFDFHWGGGIHFGPDRYLWFGVGDGGHTGGTDAVGDPGNRAQDLESLFGKLLRIDVADPDGDGPQRYGIPPDNPYVGRPGRDEIWARGLRNSWRWSFDRRTGDLWVPDTGHSRWEEVNRLIGPDPGRGANLGWRLMEGPSCFNPRTDCARRRLIRPLAVYPHPYGAAEFDCAVTGGAVYRGEEYPALQGRYFFGDYCSGRVWSVEAQGPKRQRPRQMLNTDLLITSIGEDRAGELYLTDVASGVVYQVTGTARPRR